MSKGLNQKGVKPQSDSKKDSKGSTNAVSSPSPISKESKVKKDNKADKQPKGPKKQNPEKGSSPKKQNPSKGSSSKSVEGKPGNQRKPKSPTKDVLVSPFNEVVSSTVIPHLSNSDLVKVMLIDSKLVTDDAKAYTRDNIAIYDIAITSWMYVMAESLGRQTPSFEITTFVAQMYDRIKHFGLFMIIKGCDDLASAVIECNLQPALLPMDDARFANIMPIRQWLVHFNLENPVEVARVLQCLRYLKRFSPQHTDLLEAENWNSFKALERRIAMGDRRRFSIFDNVTIPMEMRSIPCKEQLSRINYSMSYMETYIIKEARKKIARVLSDYTPHRGYFSQGSVNDGEKVPAEKLITALQKDYGYLQHFNLESALYSYNEFSYCQPTYEAHYMTVAKNFKARRAIAVEEAWRQWHMQGIRLGIEECLYAHTNITLDDQSRNQILAKRGSKSGSLATIDLSAASDHVSYGLVKTLFPEEIFSEMDKYRAKYVCYNGSKQLIRKFATSGSALCFPVETLVFWAIARVACEYAAMWLGKSLSGLSSMCATYGDDIIVPSWAAQTVIEFLELFDFDINTSKSHYHDWDKYRESCGVEVFAGYDVSSTFFPRKDITFSDRISHKKGCNAKALSSLCNLQHRLLSSNFELTAQFLALCIKAYLPDMTESHVGSPYNDVWSSWPMLTKEVYDPNGATDSKAPLQQRLQRDMERHYVLITRYPKTASKLMQEAATCMAYEKWLELGPQYETELDRLLGVTESTVSLNSLTHKGDVELVSKLY